MRTNSLLIDGIDVYSKYGIYVTESGWNELIAWPPMKEVSSNDWWEYDGIEADLSAPVLNTRNISISFAVSGVFSRFAGFFELLSDGAYHTFFCAHIGRTYTLRLVSTSSLDYTKMLGLLKLTFADDAPFSNYTYVAPSSGVMSSDSYTLDGVNLTNYGVRVLGGTLSEFLKSAAAKENMLRNIPTQSGAIYDGQNVFYKSKDVKLSCLMRADTLTELWRNWDALLYDLIKSGERSVYVSELEQAFPCFYKSCTVTSFFPDDRIWLEFSLTLTVSSALRITSDLILASESGVAVVTENEKAIYEDYAIDLQTT
jgi:hypothetical protein